MKRTAMIMLATAFMFAGESAGEVSAARHDARERELRNVSLRSSDEETLKDQMTRLALRPAAADAKELTPEEKLGLLLFISAARESAQRP